MEYSIKYSELLKMKEFIHRNNFRADLVKNKDGNYYFKNLTASPLCSVTIARETLELLRSLKLEITKENVTRAILEASPVKHLVVGLVEEMMGNSSSNLDRFMFIHFIFQVVLHQENLDRLTNSLYPAIKKLDMGGN